MENQNPTYPTQKEEPVAPTPSPSTFPTPAHPIPKFLPKPIALIFIVLIVGTLLSGLVFTVYTLGRNSVLKELNPTAPEIPPAGPVFQASPTPDPTANWKTENVSDYGFSFKYPADMNVSKTVMSIKDPAIQMLLTPSEVGAQPLILIDVHPYEVDIDKIKANDEYAGSYYTATTKNTVLNNRNVLIITKNFYTPKQGMPNKGTGYAIATNIGNNSLTIDGNIDQKKLIDQILSTFKFTE